MSFKKTIPVLNATQTSTLALVTKSATNADQTVAYVINRSALPVTLASKLLMAFAF